MLIEREGLAERTSIVATDISRGALALARKASYGAWSFREGRPDIVAQYFHRRGERLVLCERIRRLVEFGVFNLASELSASRLVGGAGFDVVLCRNVLIYFDPDTIAQVAQRLFASLKDGGWLITGPSDPPLWQHAPFETVVTSAGVVYRRIAGESRKERQWPQQPAAWPQSAAAVRAPVLPNVPAASFSAASSPGKPAEQPAPAPQPLESCIAEVTAFANHSDPVRSGAAIGAALALHPMSAELHYLHAIVQMAAGRYEAAAASLRRALYLDRSMAVAHFALGSVLERRGATEEARRSYRNVLAVCDGRRVDDLLPFSEGERAGRLVEAARAQLAHIGDDLVRRS
jgi:chemotaxis protein methyltransferase CheR